MGNIDAIQLFTRPGTYVLGIFIFIITFFVRRITEAVWPSLQKQADENDPRITYLTHMARWWNEVILFALPCFFGMLSGFMRSDFFFSGIDDVGARLMFGSVVGWFASFLYKVLRKVISQRLGVDIVPEASTRVDEPPGGAR